VTDCEAAVVSVIREMLPAVTHRLCYFQFCQANYRYVTENCGLAISYREDPDLQSGSSVLGSGLPSYNHTQVNVQRAERGSGFTSATQRCITAVLSVLSNTAIPKKMWNVHDLAASKRTNNDTEGWNAKWNRAVGKAGPGYYEAVLQLRLQQADTENVLAQVAAGIPPPPRRRKYVRRDERIAGYLARWKSPTEADIQHNDVIDSARLLRILARLL